MSEDTPKRAKSKKKSIDKDDLEGAKTRAFEALSRRAYTYGELIDKLVAVGYARSCAEAAAERVAELGYLDDSAYTKMFIDSKSNSGWGKRKIIDALHRKKVSDYCIEDALAEMEQQGEEPLSPDAQITAAVRAIGKKPCETRSERDKIIRRLVSKGFSLDCAYSALNLYVSSVEPPHIS